MAGALIEHGSGSAGGGQQAAAVAAGDETDGHAVGDTSDEVADVGAADEGWEGFAEGEFGFGGGIVTIQFAFSGSFIGLVVSGDAASDGGVAVCAGCGVLRFGGGGVEGWRGGCFGVLQVLLDLLDE